MAAGAQLLHELPIWDWSKLTVRAVAERAGVNERTVYRHFASERELRDAVLERLEEEAGVDLNHGVELGDVADVATKILRYVATFPLAARSPRDATVAAANARQRAALTGAMEAEVPSWSDRERALVAAVLDVLWSPVSFERMVTDWELAPSDAVGAIRWAIGLVVAAIGDGDRPASAPHTRRVRG